MSTVVGSIWDPPPPTGPLEAGEARDLKAIARHDIDQAVAEHQRFEALVRPLIAVDLAAAKSPVDAAVARCGLLINRLNSCRLRLLSSPERDEVCGKEVEAMNKCTAPIFCRHAIARRTAHCSASSDAETVACGGAERYLDACLTTMPDLSRISLARGIAALDLDRPAPDRVHPGMLQAYGPSPDPPVAEPGTERLRKPGYVTDPPAIAPDHSRPSPFQRLRSIVRLDVEHMANIIKHRLTPRPTAPSTPPSGAESLGSPSPPSLPAPSLPKGSYVSARPTEAWVRERGELTASPTASTGSGPSGTSASPRLATPSTGPFYNLHLRPNEFHSDGKVPTGKGKELPAIPPVPWASRHPTPSAAVESGPESAPVTFLEFVQRAVAMRSEMQAHGSDRGAAIRRAQAEAERAKVLAKEKLRHETLARRQGEAKHLRKASRQEAQRRRDVVVDTLEELQKQGQAINFLHGQTPDPTQVERTWRETNQRDRLRSGDWKGDLTERVARAQWVANHGPRRDQTGYELWPRGKRASWERDHAAEEAQRTVPYLLNFRKAPPLQVFHNGELPKFQGQYDQGETPLPFPDEILAPDPFDPKAVPMEWAGVYPPSFERPVSSLADAMFIQAADRADATDPLGTARPYQPPLPDSASLEERRKLHQDPRYLTPRPLYDYSPGDETRPTPVEEAFEAARQGYAVGDDNVFQIPLPSDPEGPYTYNAERAASYRYAPRHWPHPRTPPPTAR